MAEVRPDELDLDALPAPEAPTPETFGDMAGLRDAIAQGIEAPETDTPPQDDVDDEPENQLPPDPEDMLNRLMEMSEREVRELDYEPEVIASLVAARRSGLRQSDYSRKSAQREQEYRKKLAELEQREAQPQQPTKPPEVPGSFNYAKWYADYQSAHNGEDPPADALFNAIATHAEKRALEIVESKTSPFLSRLEQQQEQGEIEALIKDFPEIGESPETMQSVLDGTREYAQSLGIQGKPGAIRTAFMGRFGDLVMNYRIKGATAAREAQKARPKPGISPTGSRGGDGAPDTLDIRELVAAGARKAIAADSAPKTGKAGFRTRRS